jgi:hypothetical protein
MCLIISAVFLWGIAGIAFLALTVALGWALIARLRTGLTPLETMAAAPVVGTVVITWACLLAYLATASLDIAIAVTAAAAVVAVVALRPWKGGPWRLDRSHLPVLALIVLVAFLYVFPGVLNYHGGEYHIAYPLYGDAAFHSSIVTSFSQGLNYPPQYPIMAGQALRYTFLVDFYSAVLDRLGMGLQWSIVLPDVVLLSSLLALLYFFGSRFTGRRPGGALAVTLVVLSGGLGFLWAYGDWQASGVSLQDFLKTGVLNYTCMYDLGLVFTNFMIIVLAQRAALAGFAAGALVMLLLYIRYMDKDQSNTDGRDALLLAGGLAGLLPLFHTYSYACVMLSTALLFIVYRERRWPYFLAPAILLAIPQALYISGQGTQSFIRLQAGWMAGSLADIPWFWAVNLGLMLPLLIAGLYLAGREKARFYLPFLAIFVMANLIVFQPWDYDNHKFFSFWLMSSAPLMAIALLAVYDLKWIGKPLFALLLAFTVLTGALVAIFMTFQAYVEFPAASVEVAGWIKENTPPDAVFLTGDAATHPACCLAGRKSYLGYYPWMFTHGVDTSERVGIVRQIYGASDTQQAMQLLRQQEIDYVYVGPEERRSGSYSLNPAWLGGLSPLYNWTSQYGENYRIYAVPA